MEKLKLFLALPTYGNARFNTVSVVQAHTQNRSFSTITMQEVNASLLAHCFNKLWVNALNLRDEGKVTHFLLLHADIVPLQQNWVDILMTEMKANNAQAISAVVPLKDDRGLTSTAFELYWPDGRPQIWGPHRLTMTKLDLLPTTFTEAGILLNTGMLLVDLRIQPGQPDWCDKIVFTINDTILHEEGQRKVACEPEDWNFSRQCHKLGVRQFATKAVHVVHKGGFDYPNFGVWGSNETDLGDAAAKK